MGQTHATFQIQFATTLVIMCLLAGILVGCSGKNEHPVESYSEQNSTQEQTTKPLGTYYVEMSDDTTAEWEDSFFEFYDDNTFLLYTNNTIGTGTCGVDGNILSLSAHGQVVMQLTISSDYQTIAAVDGSSKFRKESRPRFNETTLSGIYNARENPNMALNYDGSENHDYDDRYYQFFEDSTFKMVFPNSKDSSSTGTYKIQGDFLEMFFSYSDGSVFYLISLDGNTIHNNSSSGGVAFTEGAWDKQ